MPDPITASYMGELLSQLCAALGKPFGAKAQKMVAVYHRVLDDWPSEAIEWAIWRACKTWKAKNFPKPAELAELCAQSPHKKLEPARPAEPEVNEAERCRECHEWWGYHRVVMIRGAAPILLDIQVVRHRSSCGHQRWLDRFMGLYQYSWVDGPPDAGRLEAGGDAWKAPGALQLIHPLPPRPAPPKTSPPSSRLPYPKPREPVPIAEVNPHGGGQ